MNNHVASFHGGNKPFKCVTCQTRFAEKPELNAHVISVHEGSKPFKCATCDTRFAENSELNNHIPSVQMCQFMKEISLSGLLVCLVLELHGTLT